MYVLWSHAGTVPLLCWMLSRNWHFLSSAEPRWPVEELLYMAASSRVSFFLSPVFKSFALSPLFSSSHLVLLFYLQCRCERVRPWKNIWFRKPVMKESVDWPLHLGTQWQMGLQFSAWLRGNKAHFHFLWLAAAEYSLCVSRSSWTGSISQSWTVFFWLFAGPMVKIDNYTWSNRSKQACLSESLTSHSESSVDEERKACFSCIRIFFCCFVFF